MLLVWFYIFNRKIVSIFNYQMNRLHNTMFASIKNDLLFIYGYKILFDIFFPLNYKKNVDFIVFLPLRIFLLLVRMP